MSTIHSGTPQQEQRAEPQQEQPPAVEPTEAEAEQPEAAPSAEAPSPTEELEATPAEATSASEADWKRWFGLAASSSSSRETRVFLLLFAGEQL